MHPHAATLVLVVVTLAIAGRAHAQQPVIHWPPHTMDRPQPPVVAPAPAARPGAPPSDAVVLFDGTDLSQWEGDSGAPAQWKVDSGWMEIVPGSGGIHTKHGFGDCQLHIEWMSPSPPQGEGQDRGNSGVFLMGRYEVQVLDSYGNRTYPDGEAAALYGQYPPLVNASRPPGEWQTYDILFHRPRFDRDGKVVRPAHVTVLYNGVLVQDDVALTGPTAHQHRPPYAPHPDALPLGLQDHSHPVRYRNIWIRALPAETP
jgi:hypothetical protein